MTKNTETRGRKPKDGVAKTSTERARELRDRDALAIVTARLASDYEKFPNRLLLKAMEDAMNNGYQRSAKKIAAEMIKRADPDIVLADAGKSN